jgi:hypothetical protein
MRQYGRMRTQFLERPSLSKRAKKGAQRERLKIPMRTPISISVDPNLKR